MNKKVLHVEDVKNILPKTDDVPFSEQAAFEADEVQAKAGHYSSRPTYAANATKRVVAYANQSMKKMFEL